MGGGRGQTQELENCRASQSITLMTPGSSIIHENYTELGVGGGGSCRLLAQICSRICSRDMQGEGRIVCRDSPEFCCRKVALIGGGGGEGGSCRLLAQICSHICSRDMQGEGRIVCRDCPELCCRKVALMGGGGGGGELDPLFMLKL